MGILNSLEVRNEGSNTITASSDLEQLLRGISSGLTESARSVTPQSAKGVSAVYAAVSVVARSVASLPLHLFRREGEDKVRVEPSEHPVAALLRRPHPWLSTYNLRDFLQRSRGFYGKGYIFINRTRTIPRELIPLHPDTVCKERVGDRLIYRHERTSRIFRPEDIVDIPWSTWVDEDGVPQGVGPVQDARETIATAMETERHGSSFMSNSAVPAGVLTGPVKTKEQIERVKASWQAAYGGKNRYKTAVLDEDFEWKPVTLPAKDAQFIEQRQFSVEDIARIFNVPASMINDNKHSTFNNSEQQALNYVVHSLMPHLEAIEAELNDKLFPGDQRDEFFVEFKVDGLLRGDYQSRMEGHALAIQNRILNPNEVRRMENMNGYDGGNEYANPNIEPQPDPES